MWCLNDMNCVFSTFICNLSRRTAFSPFPVILVVEKLQVSDSSAISSAKVKVCDVQHVQRSYSPTTPGFYGESKILFSTFNCRSKAVVKGYDEEIGC